MRRARFAKIVATLGPASSSREQLRALFEAGADVFRLNFSHGTQDDHKQRVALLRALEKQYKHPIAILMDLQGPKLRLGVVGKGPIELKKGQKLRFDMDKTLIDVEVIDELAGLLRVYGFVLRGVGLLRVYGFVFF